MNIIKVDDIRKCNTTYGKYLVEVTIKRRIKRFNKDSKGELQVEEYLNLEIKKEYFHRRKLAEDYKRKMKAKIRRNIAI